MNRHIVTFIALFIALPFNVLAMEEDTSDTPKFTPPTFSEVDSDGNEQISLEELDAYRAIMQEEFGNEDGRQLNRRDSISAFASFDKDKNGIITEEEFAAHARYSNLGNGTGQLQTYKNTNRQMNQSGNKGQGNGNSNGKGRNQ